MSRPSGPEIAAHVRELIVTGDVGAGHFLRLEPVANDLGVSVTPVREAMMHLAAQGFVKLQPRRGFQVLSITAEDIRDVYLAQGFLAGELAYRATRALSPRDIDRLEETQEQLEAANMSRALDDVESCNHRFHSTINRAADAPRLAAMLRTSAQYAPRRFFASIPGWPDASATDHRAVIQALGEGDADAAREAMRSHVEHAGELLARHRISLSATLEAL
jgi:DNA-binding GntR family transcriptional regulator